MDQISKTIISGVVPSEELNYKVLQFFSQQARGGIKAVGEWIDTSNPLSIICKAVIMTYLRNKHILGFNRRKDAYPSGTRVLMEPDEVLLMCIKAVGSYSQDNRISTPHLMEYKDFKRDLIDRIVNADIRYKDGSLTCRNNRHIAERLFHIFMFHVSYICFDKEDVREYATKLYNDTGYTYVEYFGFINEDHPLNNINNRADFVLTPEIFELYAGPWTIEDGENLARKLDEINPDDVRDIKDHYDMLRYESDTCVRVPINEGLFYPLTRYGLVTAIKSAITSTERNLMDSMKSIGINRVPTNWELNLSLITGNPIHKNIALPGFRINLAPFDVNNHFYGYLDLPQIYYMLVYRRLFNTLMYSSGYLESLNLSTDKLRCMMRQAGVTKDMSVGSFVRYIQYFPQYTPTQENINRFASLYYKVMNYKPTKKEVKILNEESVSSIISSLPLPPKPKSLIGISNELIDFLKDQGISENEIMNANTPEDYNNLYQLYVRAVRNLRNEELKGYGFGYVNTDTMTVDQLDDLINEAVTRYRLFSSLQHYFGDYSRYAELTNKEIELLLESQIGPNVWVLDVAPPKRIPEFMLPRRQIAFSLYRR